MNKIITVLCFIFCTLGFSQNLFALDKPNNPKSEFVGTWKALNSSASEKSCPSYEITLLENGEVISTTNKNERGVWAFVKDHAEIIWENGWVEHLKKDGAHFVKLGYSLQQPLNGKETNRCIVIKEDCPCKKVVSKD